MKKLNDERPKAFGEETRPLTSVSISSWKDLGGEIVTYNVHNGDVIEFPEELEAFEQPIRVGQTATGRLVRCLRNKEESFFSPGSLQKRDIDNKYVYEDFGGKDLATICNMIAGKTLTAGASVTIRVPVFVNNQRSYGDKMTPQGTKVLDADGLPVRVPITKEQTVVLVTVK